jgi:hypothetical protein
LKPAAPKYLEKKSSPKILFSALIKPSGAKLMFGKITIDLNKLFYQNFLSIENIMDIK